MLSNPLELIEDFGKVAVLCGWSLQMTDVRHQVIEAPHKPPTLPKGEQAVYVFSLKGEGGLVLKVGKVGPKSQPRFGSQHYNPNSSPSNLAKSLLTHQERWETLEVESPLTRNNVGDWIKDNTDRDHFFVTIDCPKFALTLLEVFLQCRLHPLFEG